MIVSPEGSLALSDKTALKSATALAIAGSAVGSTSSSSGEISSNAAAKTSSLNTDVLNELDVWPGSISFLATICAAVINIWPSEDCDEGNAPVTLKIKVT